MAFEATFTRREAFGSIRPPRADKWLQGSLGQDFFMVWMVVVVFLATRHFLGRVERQNQKTLPDVNRCRCEDITKMAAEIQFNRTDCMSSNQWFLKLLIAAML